MSFAKRACARFGDTVAFGRLVVAYSGGTVEELHLASLGQSTGIVRAGAARFVGGLAKIRKTGWPRGVAWIRAYERIRFKIRLRRGLDGCGRECWPGVDPCGAGGESRVLVMRTYSWFSRLPSGLPAGELMVGFPPPLDPPTKSGW